MAAANSIARYLFNEASSGTAITVAADDEGSNDLAISFNGQGSWTNVGAGNGLDSTQTTVTAPALVAQLVDISTNGDIGSSLANATEASLLMRVDLTAGSNLGARLMHIGTGPGNGDFSITLNAAGYLVCRWNADNLAGFCEMETVVTGAIRTIAIVVDTTEVGNNNRVKFYVDGSQVATTFNNIPQNSALTTINNTDRSLGILDRSAGSRNVEGAVYYYEIFAGKLTAQQITDSHSALVANNDADAFAPVALSITAGPTVDSETDLSFIVDLTVNVNANIAVLPTADGSSQPSESAFDAAVFTGNSVGGNEFNQLVDGLGEATTYTVWVRASVSGSTSIYASVQADTTPVTPQILNINGGLPVRFGQTGVILQLSQGATGSTGITYNGVAQTGLNVVSDTQVTFDLSVWPNTFYSVSRPIVIQNPGGDITANLSIIQEAGYDFVVVSQSYVSSSEVIQATPALVAGDIIQYAIIDNLGNSVSINDRGVVQIGGVSPGSFDVLVIDQVDSSISAPVTINSSGADVVPDAFSLGVNVTSSDPSTNIDRSFTVLGVDPGEVIVAVSTGDAAISVNSGAFSQNVNVELNDTITVRITSGSFDQTVVGGCEINGVSDQFEVATRSAIAPTSLSEPANQSVVVNAAWSFSFVATTNGLADPITYQWFDASNDTAITGATSSTYAGTGNISDSGRQFYCVATSAESLTVQSSTVLLTVSLSATRITSPILQNFDNTVRANVVGIPLEVRNLSGALLLQTTVNTNAAGVYQLDSAVFGSVGDTVRVEHPQSDALNTRAVYEHVLTAVT